MFVVTLTYTAEAALVDRALDEHVAWVDRQYDDGVFLASGPRVPRIGGVILATGVTREELGALLAADPFAVQGLAEYDVVEFTPRRVAGGVTGLR